MTKTWIKAAAVRALRTFAQTAAAAIGANLLVSEVNWLAVGSTAVLAAVLSILTSIGGLPEVSEEKQE